MRASSGRPCSSVSTFCCLTSLERMLNAIASTSIGSRTRTSNSSISRTSSHACAPSSPSSRAKTVAMSRSGRMLVLIWRSCLAWDNSYHQHHPRSHSRSPRSALPNPPRSLSWRVAWASVRAGPWNPGKHPDRRYQPTSRSR
jgi:hypothetical protein